VKTRSADVHVRDIQPRLCSGSAFNFADEDRGKVHVGEFFDAVGREEEQLKQGSGAETRGESGVECKKDGEKGSEAMMKC
jgi:hypothetical protein